MKAVILMTVLIALVPFVTPHPYHHDDAKHLYTGQHKFVISLLNALHKTYPHNSNVVSPHSIYHALLLAYFGAEGKTEESLKQALHLQWADSKQDVIRVYQMVIGARKERQDVQDIDFESFDKLYITEKADLK